MKKSLSKIISALLILCILCSFSVSSFSTAASEPAESVNLLAGTSPYEFYRAAAATPQTCNYKTANIMNVGERHPYIEGWFDQKPNIEPYLLAATDADTSAGYTFGIDGTSDSLVLVYKIDPDYALNDFSISFGDQDGNPCTLAVNVYSANSKSELFSNTPVTMTTGWGTSFNTDLSGMAKFVAVVVKLDSWGYWVKLKNISVTGTKVSNVLAGRIPTTMISVDSGSFSFNWTKTTVSATGLSNLFNHGFTESDGFSRRDAFIPYFAMLTDNNNETRCGMEPENNANKVLFVYELKNNTDISAIEIVSSAWQSNIDVYASAQRSTLFSGTKLANFSRAESVYTTASLQNVSASGVRYVGFYLNYTYQSNTAEIRIYGAETGNVQENLIAGKSPVAVYPVSEDGTNFSYTNPKINGGIVPFYGTDRPITPGAEYSALACMTDSYLATKASIANEWNSSEDMLLVYQLDALTDVSAVNIVAATPIPDTRIYLSRSYASLLRDENLVSSFTEDGATEHTFSLDSAEEAIYLGIILDTNISDTENQIIREIALYGEALNPITGTETTLGATLPINQNANAATKNFYQYLKNVGESKNILVGAHMQSGARLVDLSDENNYYAYIEKTYGFSPSVISMATDYPTEVYTQYAKEGAVQLFMVLGTTDAFDGLENTTGYIKYLDAEYEYTADEEELFVNAQEAFELQLEALGDFLENIEANGVGTYMIRPYNEMNIHGFYGDSANDESVHFKNVWKRVVNYLVDERNLKGVLFVYCPSNIESSLSQSMISLYPGDDYVDIIAPTMYSTDSNGYIDEITDYDALIATGKPFGMSECGMLATPHESTQTDCLHLLETFKTTYSQASFASLWFGYRYGINNHLNDTAFINDDYLLGLEDAVNYQYEAVSSVTVYAQSDFGGNNLKIMSGRYNTADLNSLNVASLAIQKGYKITLYSGADCTGESWKFGRDVSDFTSLQPNVSFNSFTVETAGSFKLYDTNDDTKINITDLVRMKKGIANVTTQNELAADINNSGRVDAADMIMLVKEILSR